MSKKFKHISILGAGESGTGAAVLAVKKGFPCLVSDSGKIKEEFKKELQGLGVEFEEGKHTEKRILASDLIIKSPGIPDTAELVVKAVKAGIAVISEIEFAGYFSKRKMICITGSNGKTTTTMLIYHILKKAGLNLALAGNVGKSLARLVAADEHEYYVVELSSFQLDGMFEFKADIAILLNITPDHLDRYGYEMQNYVNSKLRILQNQTANDWLVFNADDPYVATEVAKRNPISHLAPFSIEKTDGMTGYLNNNQIHINLKPNFTMSIHDLSIKGRHNVQNSLAAAITSRVIEIRNESLRESLSDFKNVEHRLEHVAKVNGIEFINDSKATNVNSVWYALECMDKPVVWIVGGVDKGNDYESLLPLVKSKVKSIVCLGINNKKILEAFSGCVDVIAEAHSAMEAVAYSYRMAKSGEVVLLSPACASFDLFKNYEDRGDQFKEAVRAL